MFHSSSDISITYVHICTHIAIPISKQHLTPITMEAWWWPVNRSKHVARIYINKYLLCWRVLVNLLFICHIRLIEVSFLSVKYNLCFIWGTNSSGKYVLMYQSVRRPYPRRLQSWNLQQAFCFELLRHLRSTTSEKQAGITLCNDRHQSG